MTQNNKKILAHILACCTQIMWGATFVSTKVLLQYFLPVQVLFTRAVLAFLALLIFYPHHLKLKSPKQEFAFAGAGLFGIVLYFMLENTALSMTYASNVGIIVACAPFFVAVMVGFFFKNEKSGLWFYIGFVIAVTRRIYFYGILFLIPVLLIQHASWNVVLFRDTEIAANFLILGFSGKLKTELQ